jgi:CheY-like chemotaxis protein
VEHAVGYANGGAGIQVAEGMSIYNRGMPKPRVLVADDEPAIRLLFKVSLEKRGFEVELAANGREAIEMLKKGYDVVVSDMAMPQADGLDVLAAATAARIPVIICSGYHTEDSRARARSMGAAMLLDKPIAPSLLADAVEALAKA